MEVRYHGWRIKKKVALFRYGLIAPLINNAFSEATAKEYLEAVCAKSYDVPYYGQKSFAPTTLKTWLRLYRLHGIDGLYPKERNDKGNCRTLSEKAKQFIIDAKRDNPSRPVKSIYHQMLANGLIEYNQVSLSTVQRFVNECNLGKRALEPKDRRAFEMEYPNDCWQSDISVGPYLYLDNRKVKTYIIAFLDDASRVITHIECFTQDNLLCVLSAFKKAVAKRGIPKKLFVDNGKVYRSDQMQLICASLGTVLSYAQPYTPEAKGYGELSVM